MADTIKTYLPGTTEYKRLKAAASIIESFTNLKCVVADTYFDAGQDWSWTTIIATSPKGSEWQMLSPRDHEIILTKDLDAFNECVKSIIDKQGNH